MPPRACIISTCTRPAIAGLSRCSTHRRGGSPGPSPYDSQHKRNAKRAVQKSGGICAICGLPPSPGDPLQGDHIVPLSMGGRNIESNYQAVHRSCNIRKGGRNRGASQDDRPVFPRG